jgi:hypothetical protein
MPDVINPKRKNGHHQEPQDPALVRADLVRARHHFEDAADLVRQDIDQLREMVTLRMLWRSRPVIFLGVGLAAGIALGLILGALRRD